MNKSLALLLSVKSMVTTIEQYWSRIFCHNNFVKAKDASSCVKTDFGNYDVLLKCALLANIKRHCWSIQVVE